MTLAQLHRAASKINPAFQLIETHVYEFENAVWRLSLRFEQVPAAELLLELRCFIPWSVAALSVHRRESVSVCAPETWLILTKQRLFYPMQLFGPDTDPSSRRAILLKKLAWRRSQGLFIVMVCLLFVCPKTLNAGSRSDFVCKQTPRSMGLTNFFSSNTSRSCGFLSIDNELHCSTSKNMPVCVKNNGLLKAKTMKA